jgi:hypothetical protein
VFTSFLAPGETQSGSALLLLVGVNIFEALGLIDLDRMSIFKRCAITSFENGLQTSYWYLKVDLNPLRKIATPKKKSY